MRFVDAHHRDSVAADQLLRNLCCHVYVHVRARAKHLDSSKLDGNRQAQHGRLAQSNRAIIIKKLDFYCQNSIFS